jgi:hypothetical protein
VGWLWIALLGLAVAVLVTAEWPRLADRLPFGADAARKRRRRRSDLRLVRTEELDDDSDEFAASVERDLARLPTIKERDRNR